MTEASMRGYKIRWVQHKTEKEYPQSQLVKLIKNHGSGYCGWVVILTNFLKYRGQSKNMEC